MSAPDLQRIADALIPRWHSARFVFLETRPWWAPSVQTEANRMLSQRDSLPMASLPETGTTVRCESFTTTRKVWETVSESDSDGVVLMVDGQMRDALLLLGRLTRLCRTAPPVLVVIRDRATPLLPVLLEAGAAGVMRQPVQDSRIAEWCCRVLTRNLRCMPTTRR